MGLNGRPSRILRLYESRANHFFTANSRYATIRSDPATGSLYLYIKEAERSHLPSKWWERIKLPSNYTKALAMVDSHLQYYPKFLVHKNKQRFVSLGYNIYSGHNTDYTL
jgi:hypothetical protein